jgi:hypothetical protein
MKQALGKGKESSDDGDADDDDPAADDDEDEDDDDDLIPDGKSALDAEAEKRLAALDASLEKLSKIKNGKQLRKAIAKHARDVKAHQDEVAKSQGSAAEQAKMVADARKDLGPIAETIAASTKGDWRGVRRALDKMFEHAGGWQGAAKELWNVSKDGAATADLRHQVAELEKRLEAKEGKGKDDEPGDAPEGTMKRSSFDRKLKNHKLADVDEDGDLLGEAWDRFEKSWDDDLETYGMTPKEAADAVLKREQRRAAKLTGKRAKPDAPAKGDGDEPAKPLSKMTRDERNDYFMKRAIRMSEAEKRENARRS